jgi:DNA-binding winged helix-turn-helix (wHTH) protein/Tol biopolymer transport system component
MQPRTPKPSPASDAQALPQAYAFDDFLVDVPASKLIRGAEVVALPSRIFDVLVFLIQHRERPVKKDEIIAKIWDNVIVTDDSLIHAISVLRRALGDEPHEHRYIETIPRRGYRFVGKVQAVDLDAAGQQPAEPAAPVLAVARPASPAEEPLAAGAATAGMAMPPARMRSFLPRATRMTLATSVVAAIFATLFFIERDAADAPTPLRHEGNSVSLVQPSPPGMSIVAGGVLSPDGRYLAFVARDDKSGKTGLWVRALQSQEPRLIKGSEGASKPFWSPESGRIGFFANGTLFVTGLNSDVPEAIADVRATAGATWGQDDTILFADWSTGIYAVPASGDGQSAPVMLLERESQDIAYAWPQFLPDGARFLYQVVSLDSHRSGTYIGDTTTGRNFKLLDTASAATFAPPHHLLYVQKDMLIAEEIDPERLVLTGPAMVVARGISEPALAVESAVSASADLLAFRHGIRKQNMVWYNRDGEALASLPMPTVLYNPRLSPDGDRLMASSLVTSNPGLWLTRLDREEYARVEVDALAPIWSPDGKRVAYTSRNGADMMTRTSDGFGATTRLMTDAAVKILSDWTPDGTQIIYTRQSAGTGLDLWVVDVASGVAQPLLATPSSESQARLSPDGQWIAYASDESGMLETYVARFPTLEDKVKVSTNGGGQPQWRADQGELFYLSSEQTLMATTVTQGLALGFSAPQVLFRTPITGDPGEARDFYAANAAGTQFLIDAPAQSSGNPEEITILVNWAAGLRASASNDVALAPDAL